jgi:predicted amidohydrolase YtcJ
LTRKSTLVFAFLLTLILLSAGSARTAVQPQPVQPADLVLTNGRIVTVEAALPEAQAVAVRGERIIAIGRAADMQPLMGPATQVVDLHGQLVIPGFVEGHGHFTGVGEAQLNLKLMPTTSWDQIVTMVGEAAKAAKPGEWIIGRGWHQEKWTSRPNPNVEGFPMHASLDAVSPDNPVVLTHASGHASFVNAKAMEVSDINRSTPNPPGGEILKDSAGNPRPASCIPAVEIHRGRAGRWSWPRRRRYRRA